MPTYSVEIVVVGESAIATEANLKRLLHEGKSFAFKRILQQNLRPLFGKDVELAADGTVTSDTPPSSLTFGMDAKDTTREPNIRVNLVETKAPDPAPASSPAQSIRYSMYVMPSPPIPAVPSKYYGVWINDESQMDKTWKALKPEIAVLIERAKAEYNGVVEDVIGKAGTVVGYSMRIPWTGKPPSPIRAASDVLREVVPHAAAGQTYQLVLEFKPMAGERLPAVSSTAVSGSVLFPSTLTVVDLTRSPVAGSVNLQCVDAERYGGGYCTSWMQWLAWQLAKMPASQFWSKSAEERQSVYRQLYTNAQRAKSQDVYNAIHTAVNPSHRSQRIIVKNNQVVTTNPTKNPWSIDENTFITAFKKTILEPLAAKNGFRVVVPEGTDPFHPYDVLLGETTVTGALAGFVRLVEDTATKTPILFYTMTGQEVGSDVRHAIGGIYFPSETRIELFTTYPVPDLTKWYKAVPTATLRKGGRKSRRVRKALRRRTLRKHK